ncbi:hypothetical protein KKA69_00775 [Patescibacteria group bacterium]|nr:hypothetical protein [Patescibacteria group bacterium]
MEKNRIIQKLLVLLFFLWVLAAGIKTLIHLNRAIGETTAFINSPGFLKEHFPEIKVCQPKPINASDEESHLWEYRNMGAKCEE